LAARKAAHPLAPRRLEREAGRRGVEPDALAAELLAAEPGAVEFDWDKALSELAEIRGRVRVRIR
jgi:hypothetical protein